MLKDFELHIERNFSFLKTTPFLIAVSGGIDSVILVHLFHKLNYNFGIAHCNFKLRKQASDEDETFVKKLGEELNIKVFTKAFDTNKYVKDKKLSIQIAARKLRYDWFDLLLEQKEFAYVVTAHHADDNLETFIINLTRSTGLDGLIGIPKINNKTVRPLLSFSRNQIKNYALANNISWREDESNAEEKYLRNKIRHNVIPVLKEIDINILKNYERVAQNLSESKAILDDKINEISQELLEKDGDLVKINIEKVLKLSNPKAYLYHILKPYNFTEWNNVNSLLKSQTGKVIYSQTHEMLRDREFLLIYERKLEQDLGRRFEINFGMHLIDKNLNLTVEKMSQIEEVDKKCILVNKNLVTFPMIIRRWEVGDIFYPTGMQGRKKVSKFFKDEKLSKFQKEKTWLLCTKENEIIWIVGMRQDRRFYASASTKNVLKISI